MHNSPMHAHRRSVFAIEKIAALAVRWQSAVAVSSLGKPAAVEATALAVILQSPLAVEATAVAVASLGNSSGAFCSKHR